MERQIEIIVNNILKDPENIDLSYGIKAKLIAKAISKFIKKIPK
jgi:hypothetical protein